MLGAVGETCDVVDGAVVVDDENVVLAVAAGARLAFGDHDHRFHSDDHPGRKDRLNVLP